jgi:hypothetical protein
MESGAAMYGNPTVTFKIDRATGEPSDEDLVYGPDGKLTNDHRYLSAIVVEPVPGWEDAWRAANGYGGAKFSNWLPALDAARRSGRPPDGAWLAAWVVETCPALSSDAVALPASLFDGRRDNRLSWRRRESRTRDKWLTIPVS